MSQELKLKVRKLQLISLGVFGFTWAASLLVVNKIPTKPGEVFGDLAEALGVVAVYGLPLMCISFICFLESLLRNPSKPNAFKESDSTKSGGCG